MEAHEQYWCCYKNFNFELARSDRSLALSHVKTTYFDCEVTHL